MAADKILDKSRNPEELSEFEKLLNSYDYTFNKGDLVTGTVIGFESAGALIDIGAKTAALVPNKEVSNAPIKSADDVLKPGDQKEFLIIREEDEDGQLTLSLKKVAAAYSWQKLEDLKKEDSVVAGEVTSVVKGGVLVDVMGLRGFVPSSHIRAKDIDTLVGETIELKILSVDQQQNNLILSHRKVVTDQQAEVRKDVFDKLGEGQVVEGEVVRLADFGAFIDIGGIDGLLPLSQMSWRWVDHPSDLLTVGEKIKVEIIGIDFDKQRVSLSLKSLQPDPWLEASNTLKEGQQVEGTIIRIKHFGAFIEVYPGVEALLPYKEVQDFQNKSGTILEVGQKITTTVVRFNPEDRRISLSLTGGAEEESSFKKEGARMEEKDKSKQEETKKEEKQKAQNEDTQEPDVTDNEGVTHISPPCNEG